VLFAVDGETGRPLLDHETGLLGVVAVDLHENGEDVGDAGVGDEDLLAVHDVVLAVRRQDRLALGRERVAAAARFGQGVGRDELGRT